MRLIAQLLDYAQRTLRSMKTAQTGLVRGKNNWMFMDFLCADVHVLDVYSSMHANKHYMNFAFQKMEKIWLNWEKVVIKHEML